MTDGKHTASLRVTARYSVNQSSWILQLAHGSHGPRFSFRGNQAREISDRIIDLIEDIETKNGHIDA